MYNRIAKNNSSSQLKQDLSQGLLFSKQKVARLSFIKIKVIKILKLQVSRKNKFQYFQIIPLKIKLDKYSLISC
jgi:hypothetical protein